MQKGDLIGQGMTAEVYDWGPDKILKLYYQDIPEDWGDYEAFVGRAVFQSGAPAPEVFEIVKEESRTGLIYERVKGFSLRYLLQTKPSRVIRLARQMARFHALIHQSHSDKLIGQNQRFSEAIQESASVLGERAETIQEYLLKMPVATHVCHGDFHADNILISDNDIKAIDWMNAYTGDPLGDVARALIMLQSPFLPPDIPTMMVAILKVIRKMMTAAYLREYLKITGTKRENVDQWILPVAAARLRENVPGEKEWLMTIIDQELKKINKF